MGGGIRQMFKNFRKKATINMKIVWAVITGTASITALAYLGSAAEVLGAH